MRQFNDLVDFRYINKCQHRIEKKNSDCDNCKVIEVKHTHEIVKEINKDKDRLLRVKELIDKFKNDDEILDEGWYYDKIGRLKGKIFIENRNKELHMYQNNLTVLEGLINEAQSKHYDDPVLDKWVRSEFKDKCFKFSNNMDEILNL